MYNWRSNKPTRLGCVSTQSGTPFTAQSFDHLWRLGRSYHNQLGLEHVYLDAVIGTIAALHPSLFRTQHCPVEIETFGEIALGQTVFDRRGYSTEASLTSVAIEADTQEVYRRIVSG